jgi:hypothetical protein
LFIFLNWIGQLNSGNQTAILPHQKGLANCQSFGNLNESVLLSNRQCKSSTTVKQLNDVVKDELNAGFDRSLSLDDEEDDDNESGQWHQPKVAATSHIYGELSGEKKRVEESRPEVSQTPIKRDSVKKVTLIKLFGARKPQSDKTKRFFCDNPTFVNVSPKN